jgi:SAM-dependent methyltransferase
MTTDAFAYVGSELELFEDASNWKSYWASKIKPYLGPRVAEIGAGIGTNTQLLNHRATRWLCVEPDQQMARRIKWRLRAGELGPNCDVLNGRIVDLPRKAAFDTILYIDVLEHIAKDRLELSEAGQRIVRGGYLVVLSPAHQWLYSPFDAAIGHVRRYARDTLGVCRPEGFRLVSMQYLDSVGVMASLANRCLLRSAEPTPSQIQLWDKKLVPMSRLLDRLTGYHLGKSILAVWQRR